MGKALEAMVLKDKQKEEILQQSAQRAKETPNKLLEVPYADLESPGKTMISDQKLEREELMK